MLMKSMGICIMSLVHNFEVCGSDVYLQIVTFPLNSSGVCVLGRSWLGLVIFFYFFLKDGGGEGVMGMSLWG